MIVGRILWIFILSCNFELFPLSFASIIMITSLLFRLFVVSITQIFLVYSARALFIFFYSANRMLAAANENNRNSACRVFRASRSFRLIGHDQSEERQVKTEKSEGLILSPSQTPRLCMCFPLAVRINAPQMNRTPGTGHIQAHCRPSYNFRQNGRQVQSMDKSPQQKVTNMTILITLAFTNAHMPCRTIGWESFSKPHAWLLAW